jgi:hypothetical protein
MAGGDQGDLQKIDCPKDISMSTVYAVKPSRGYVGSQTITRFREEFQVYFPPALLASAVAYVCIYLLQLLREKLVIPPSFESIMEPARFAVPRFLYALGRTFIWSIECWVVWLVFTLMLAAVSLRVLQERQSPDAPMTMGEAFQLVCKRRLGALIGVSGLAGVATAFFNVFLLPLLLRPLPLLLFQLNWFRYDLVVYKLAIAVLTLLFAALLAKMTLAIPELMDDQNVLLWQSIRNSIAATAGWEVFFLLEFGFWGLVGGSLYFFGENLLETSWSHGQLTLTGYQLMLAAFTILLTGLALALLAIAHSLVYVSLRYGAAPSLVETEN